MRTDIGKPPAATSGSSSGRMDRVQRIDLSVALSDDANEDVQEMATSDQTPSSPVTTQYLQLSSDSGSKPKFVESAPLSARLMEDDSVRVARIKISLPRHSFDLSSCTSGAYECSALLLEQPQPA